MSLKLFNTLLFLILSLQLSAQQLHRGSARSKTNAEYEQNVYKLLSSDSVKYNVTVRVKKYEYDKIFIFIGSDSLCMGYWYWYKISVINNRFLIVTHGVRIGSGVHQELTIILAIKDGHFVQCFSFESMYRESIEDWGNPHSTGELKTLEYTLDSVGYQITKEPEYHIHAYDTIHKESTVDIANNYSTKATVNLKFDNSLNIFYDEYANLNDYYKQLDDCNFRNSDGTEKTSEVHLNGNYPIVNLGEDSYIFVEGKWYVYKEHILFPIVERCDCKVPDKTRQQEHIKR